MSEKSQSLELEVAGHIRYSPESDVLYFLFTEGEEEYFEEPIPGVHVEYDKKGNILGIEVLHASQMLKDILAQMLGNFLSHAMKEQALERDMIESYKKLMIELQKKMV